MTRTCLDCNEELSGRKDKKFCNDMCRVNYHNTLAQEKQKKFRKINTILLKNRNILSTLERVKKYSISRLELQNSGFNFNYYTHVSRIGKKKITFVYDYGFEFLKPSIIKIIPNEE